MKEAKLNPRISTTIPPATGPISDPKDHTELKIPEIRP